MVLLITAALAACSSTPPSGTGGGGASSSSGAMTGTGGMTSSSSGSTGGGGASSSSSGGGGSGGSGGTGGMMMPGVCGLKCATAADCCPPNQPNCPSDKFPNNYTCDNSVCGSPQCQSDDDCTAGGQLPQYVCGSVDSGFKSCIRPCADDTQCPRPSICTGVADDMSKYCKVESEPFVCAQDADCAGFGKCNAQTGECYCLTKDDCKSPFVNACLPK